MSQQSLPNHSARNTNAPDGDFQSRKIRFSAARWEMLDTSHWRSICDVTLTLKQALGSKNSHMWTAIDEVQAKKAFRHFMKLLNREVYGNAVHRHGKRLRVIDVVEKDEDGRWHIHAAIEPPTRLDAAGFESLICQCWDRTDWGHCRIQVRHDANQGWVDYMLKFKQKSGLENWLDCIDLDCLHNPIADA